ncbi:MAG: MarR family transcriptional regulator [Bacillota bacterium]
MAEQADPNCCVPEVGDLVQRLVRVFHLFERDQIKIFGFTTSQCYTLVEIARSGPLPMNELSTKMNLDTSTMTRIVDNLVRDGLVQRVKDKNDRRYVVVELTERGKESETLLRESIEAYYRDIIDGLPRGQVRQVLDSVRLLLAAFEKANPHCC